MFTLFFVDDLPMAVGGSYEFANDDANHAIRVLRMQVGAEFMLSDGNGSWSQVVATEVKKKSMQVRVMDSGFQAPLATTITVVQALPKGDRAKEAIELLTEAGVDRIVPSFARSPLGNA